MHVLLSISLVESTQFLLEHTLRDLEPRASPLLLSSLSHRLSLCTYSDSLGISLSHRVVTSHLSSRGWGGFSTSAFYHKYGLRWRSGTSCDRHMQRIPVFCSNISWRNDSSWLSDRRASHTRTFQRRIERCESSSPWWTRMFLIWAIKKVPVDMNIPPYYIHARKWKQDFELPSQFIEETIKSWPTLPSGSLTTSGLWSNDWLRYEGVRR